MNVHFNITEIVNTFTFPKSEVREITQKVVQAATWAAYDELMQLSDELKSTRRAYKQGVVQPVFVFGNIIMLGKVELIGVLPNMIEQGADPFDMKEGFRKSAKAVHRMVKNKDGAMENRWYLTIPFRHASSEAIAESMAFSSRMPKEIENLVKGNAEANPTPQGSSVGLTMSQLYRAGATGKGLRSEEGLLGKGKLSKEQRADYQHKSPMYLGLQKDTHTYDKAQQGKYMTFRRVSSASAVNSWIHKGLVARNFMDKAANSDTVAAAMEAALVQEAARLGI